MTLLQWKSLRKGQIIYGARSGRPRKVQAFNPITLCVTLDAATRRALHETTVYSKNDRYQFSLRQKHQLEARFLDDKTEDQKRMRDIERGRELLRWVREKRIVPTVEGYYIMFVPKEDEKRWRSAFKGKVLVNPSRWECEDKIPRTIYHQDHIFDLRDEKTGEVIIEKEEVFWRRHKKAYREWLKQIRANRAARRK